MRRPWLLLIAPLITAAPAPALAQDTPVTDLVPQAADGLDAGKVSIVEGTTGPEGDKFNVPGLSYFQPTSVTLIADRQGDDIRLKLGKFNWDEDFMGGNTRANGYHIDRFRTQGDLLITVSSDKSETPYRLLVWTGEEQNLAESEPALVEPSATDGLAKWIGIGLLVLAGLAAAFYFGRKRRSAAA